MPPDPTTVLRDLVRQLVREVLAEERAAPASADHNIEVVAGAPRGEWITDVDLASWLAISRETIQQWRSRGEGPPFHKVGRAVRYRVVEVRAWIDARKRG